MDNVPLLEKLAAEISVDSHPALLHSLTTKILNKRYQELLHSILKNKPPSKESINVLDERGLSPFLAYVEHFCSRYASLRAEIIQLVSEAAQKHRRKFSLSKMDIGTLFAPKEPQ
jgi:hypothetical protein